MSEYQTTEYRNVYIQKVWCSGTIQIQKLSSKFILLQYNEAPTNTDFSQVTSVRILDNVRSLKSGCPGSKTERTIV